MDQNFYVMGETLGLPYMHCGLSQSHPPPYQARSYPQALNTTDPGAGLQPVAMFAETPSALICAHSAIKRRS